MRLGIFDRLQQWQAEAPTRKLHHWVERLEDRLVQGKKDHARTTMVPQSGAFTAKEWAKPEDIEELKEILAKRPDLKQPLVAAKHDHLGMESTNLLDRVLGVSPQGAVLMMGAGLVPTQESLNLVARKAINYTNDRHNEKISLGPLNARLPDAPFAYSSLARSFLKQEGLDWYAIVDRSITPTSIIMATPLSALRKAIKATESKSNFQQELEEEQARQGWRVGRLPLIEHPGKKDQEAMDRLISITVAGDGEDLTFIEQMERTEELLMMGANANAIAPLGKQPRQRSAKDPVTQAVNKNDMELLDKLLNSPKPEPNGMTIVGLSIFNSAWSMLELLMKHGGKIDLTGMDRALYRPIYRILEKERRFADPDERDIKSSLFTIGEVLKKVSRYVDIPWEREIEIFDESLDKYGMSKTKGQLIQIGEFIGKRSPGVREEIDCHRMMINTPVAETKKSRPAARL